MARNFNPADVESFEIKFDLTPVKATNEQLAFLVRRAARRIRRDARAL